MYHMHTLGASKCMHVVHSVSFRKVLVLGRHTLTQRRQPYIDLYRPCAWEVGIPNSIGFFFMDITPNMIYSVI